MIVCTSFQRLFILLSVIVFFIIYGRNYLPTQLSSEPQKQDNKLNDARCAAYPDKGNIAIAIKTNTADASLELLNRAATIFHCLPRNDLLFLSDLEQTIGPYHIHNVLSQADPDFVQSSNDFTLYRQQHHYAKRGLDVHELVKDPVLTSQTIIEQEHGYENLDKYKLLHMVGKAWELQPGKDWYVFADPSAYYVWPNLVRWLGDVDPSQPRFFSKVDRVATSDLDIAEAHSGFILSGAAVKQLMSHETNIPNEWDKKAASFASGQEALAEALDAKIDLRLSDAWPLMIGEEPGLIPFQQEIWCEPVVGMPSVSSDLALQLLRLEQSLLVDDPSSIFTYKQLFSLFAALAKPKTALHSFLDVQTTFLFHRLWDNKAYDTNPELIINWSSAQALANPKSELHDLKSFDPNTSPATCARACEVIHDCHQFGYMAYDARMVHNNTLWREGGVCHLSRGWRFGVERAISAWDDDGGDKENGKLGVANTQTWSSGWDLRKWNRDIERMRCGVV